MKIEKSSTSTPNMKMTGCLLGGGTGREDPKRETKLEYYSNFPDTRMGAAWKMREQFQKAADLVSAQDDWDSACAAGERQTMRRPKDLSLDSVVALLRGEATLHNHCYQVHDMVRNSNSGLNLSSP
eukprot:COSAG02_NODE_35323_length_470_cov_0.832884_1_plen_126_part_00